jgi:hypothetical protein
MKLIVLTLLLLGTVNEHRVPDKVNWGFYGHKKINRLSIFTLPNEMFGFYKEHIEYITEHAVDPDKRRYAMDGEAPCHYIDLDHFYQKGEDPYTVMPKRWKDAVAKFSEDTLMAYGIVPWHIQRVKYKLQRAFERKNLDLILKYSADIGHYIADAHVPLHTTENYNGYMTNQKGIHALWESRLVEVNADSYDYFVGKASYVKDVLGFAWNTVKGSHMALDSVFYMEIETTDEIPSDRKYSYERRGNVTVKVYSKEFCDLYHQKMNGMVERRMKKAIISIGSIWYTAWVDAGQPDLRELQHIQPSEDLVKELETLDAHFKNGTHKGRICD